MALGPTKLKRFVHTFTHVITGCLFFYVVLVGMSYYSKGTTLDTLPYNAWSRMASRATAAAAIFPYMFWITSTPSSLWSLFWATWTCCAFAVHMMIVATDTKIFEDPAYHDELVRQGSHPLLSYLPRKLAIALGLLGYLLMTLCGLERTYGCALRRRQRYFPAWVCCSLAYIGTVYVAWFSDRLVNAIRNTSEMEEILYPTAFLVMLAISGGIGVMRNRDACNSMCRKAKSAKVGKKEKVIKAPLVESEKDEAEKKNE